MKTLSGFFVAVVAVHAISVAAVAADWRFDVSRAADQLEHKAEHLHDTLHRYRAYRHLDRDADALAKEAKRFHAIADRAVFPARVRLEFQGLRAKYLHLVQTFNRIHVLHHDRHVDRDFHDVQDAFRDLESAIRHLGHDHDHGHGGHGHGGHGPHR